MGTCNVRSRLLLTSNHDNGTTGETNVEIHQPLIISFNLQLSSKKICVNMSRSVNQKVIGVAFHGPNLCSPPLEPTTMQQLPKGQKHTKLNHLMRHWNHIDLRSACLGQWPLLTHGATEAWFFSLLRSLTRSPGQMAKRRNSKEPNQAESSPPTWCPLGSCCFCYLFPPIYSFGVQVVQLALTFDP